jgi:signal peptidase I
MATRRTTTVLLLLAIAAGLFVIGRYVLRPSVVVGQSMEPTLQSWELCLSLRTPHYRPQRGDIVTFRTADDPPLYLVKRVVGLPGETVGLEGGVVQINGQPLPEPYTTVNPSWQMPATNVPPGKVFVLGDNRDVDLDATVHGLVATRLVLYRLVWHGRWRK